MLDFLRVLRSSELSQQYWITRINEILSDRSGETVTTLEEAAYALSEDEQKNLTDEASRIPQQLSKP